jgi:hypothetical protein
LMINRRFRIKDVISIKKMMRIKITIENSRKLMKFYKKELVTLKQLMIH